MQVLWFLWWRRFESSVFNQSVNISWVKNLSTVQHLAEDGKVVFLNLASLLLLLLSRDLEC